MSILQTDYLGITYQKISCLAQRICSSDFFCQTIQSSQFLPFPAFGTFSDGSRLIRPIISGPKSKFTWFMSKTACVVHTSSLPRKKIDINISNGYLISDENVRIITGTHIYIMFICLKSILSIVIVLT